MTTTRFNPVIMLLGLLTLVGGPWAESALANPITSTSTTAGWFTSRRIAGNVGAAHVGENITITYPAGTIPASQTATVKADGSWRIFPPATVPAATPVTITSTIPGCRGPTPAVVAQLLNPPSNFATANHTILTGLASVGGNTFTLSGGYTVTATAIDYDPLSSTFGDLSGAILTSGFNVTGSGVAGAIGLTLSGDQAYTVSMLPIFPPNDPIGGSITLNIPVSGTVTFKSMSSPFSGFVTGTSTYGEDGAETYAYMLNLNSNFGAITGSVSSFGVAQLVPESGSFTLFSLGALGLLGCGWWRTKRAGSAVVSV